MKGLVAEVVVTAVMIQPPHPTVRRVPQREVAVVAAEAVGALGGEGACQRLPSIR